MFLNYLPRKMFDYFIESQIGDKKLSRLRVDLINLSLGIVLVYLHGLSLLRKILRRGRKIRGTLLAITIIWTIFFSAITMADVWLRERPISMGGIILGILCAVAAILVYYGVENDEYDEND